MANIKLGGTTVASESSGAVALGTGVTMANATFPAGHVLQIRSSTKNDVWTSTATDFVDITGTDQNGSGSIWCVKITPSATSSKILVYVSILWSYGTATNSAAYARLMKDSTEIGVTNSQGASESGCFCLDGHSDHYYFNRRESHHFLDSPTIPSTPVEIAYKLQMGRVYNGITNLTLNSNGYGAYDSADTNQVMKGVSTITVTEVAG